MLRLLWAVRLRELLAERGRDPAAFPIETMIDYSSGPDVWAEQVPAWEASGGSVLSLRTMSTGADYHGAARFPLADPAGQVAALSQFVRVVRG